MTNPPRGDGRAGRPGRRERGPAHATVRSRRFATHRRRPSHLARLGQPPTGHPSPA